MKDSDEWLDEIVDNLWGRALDMTSDDFKDDGVYQKAQTNYRNYSKKELQAAIQAHYQPQAAYDEPEVTGDTSR